MSSKTATQSKNPLDRLLARIDAWQQRHRFAAFPYAVVKKYGDDEAGYQGALLTYYSFLSLFPLLLVATSVIDLITRHHPEARDRLLDSIGSFFPIVGNGLQSSIHGSSKTGVALVLGLIITLYGARGIANAVRSVLNHVWAVPRAGRSGFPVGLLKSFGLIGGAGLGLLAAGVLSGFSTAWDHGWTMSFLLGLASLAVLFAVFWFVFTVGSSSRHKWHDNILGACLAAVGLQILQIVGGYLITHELKNLNGLYGQFALVLALLFWIYLQAQVFLYAAEVNTVRALRLWPRSLTGKPLTAADEKAYRLYAQREAYRPADEQEITVSFRPGK
jgi:YihY family inner membrane protein